MKTAGPFIKSDDGDTMIGTMLVLDVATRQEAQAFADNDPYNKAGLFEAVEIHPWKHLIGGLPKPDGQCIIENGEMAYWLFKSEPNTWGWQDQLDRKGKGEHWDGVRNFLANKHMKAMKLGDRDFSITRSMKSGLWAQSK